MNRFVNAGWLGGSIALLLALPAAAAPRAFRLTPLDPASLPVSVRPATAPGADSAGLRGFELELPGRAHAAILRRADASAYVRMGLELPEALRRTLRASGGAGRADTCVVFGVDLERGVVRWMALTNATHEDVLDSVHVRLAGRDSCVVLDTRDGSRGPAWPQDALLWLAGGVRLRIRPDDRLSNTRSSLTAEIDDEVLPEPASRVEVASAQGGREARPNQSLVGYDLVDGATRWRRRILNGGFLDARPAAGGGPLLVWTGKALESVQPGTGEGWVLARSSAQSNAMLAGAGAVLGTGLGLWGAVAGRGLFVMGPELHTSHHQGATPRLSHGTMFWVAGREALALDPASGAVRWSATLDPRPGAQVLYVDEATVDVRHLGARLVDDVLDPVDAGALTRLDAATGARLGAWGPPEGEALLARVRSDGRTWALTTGEVVALDESLRVTARWEAAKREDPVRLATAPGAVLVRTRGGVLGLSSDSLAVRWRVALEEPRLERVVSRALATEWKRQSLEDAVRDEAATASWDDVPFAVNGSWKPAARPLFLGRYLPLAMARADGAAWVTTRAGFVRLATADGRVTCTLPYEEGSETTLGAGGLMMALHGPRVILAWAD
jgi:hypothetical protein